MAVSITPSTSGGEPSLFANEISCGVGTDQACYAIINGLVNLGGKLTFSPVMTAWGNGRIDVFYIASNGHVQQRIMLNGNFQWNPNWIDLGFFCDAQYLSTGVACSQNQIDLIARDLTYGNELRLFSYTESAGWKTMDLGLASPADPAMCSSIGNRLDILALDSKGNLNYRYRVGATWSAWQIIGETNSTWAKPAVTSWGGGRIDVVVVGSDNAFYHKWFDGFNWLPTGANNWAPLGGALNTAVAPVAASPKGNWVEVFVKGTDSKWYTNSYNGSSWEGWILHNVVLR